MLFNAINGNIKIGDTDMDYISFGNGQKNLIMIPGLGDAVKTVKGTATTFAVMYREFAKDYKVYVFSRKNQLEEGYSTKDMAKDQVEVMKKLGISKASIMGVSQGGMIAQYIAIDYPELIDKLVLAVTVSRQNETIQSVISSWIAMAEANDYKGIIIDTIEKSYSDKNIKKYRLLYPILSRIGKPKDFSRFINQANACIQHNTYSELDKIKCKTLVIGGDSDRFIRIYNKKQERKDNADIEVMSEHLWRVEIELKRDMVDYWNDCFNDLHILKPDWSSLEKVKDQAMIYMLIHEESTWGKLERRTKNKYREMLKSISEIDLTDLMKLTLKENEKQLQKQIEFWQREFRFWE